MLKQTITLKRLQDFLGKILAVIPLSPNHWTALSLIIALGGGIAIALFENLILGIILFALAGAFDLIDGAVARARGETTKAGGFIDGLTDRFVEAIFLFSFMFYPLPNIYLGNAYLIANVWLCAVIFLGTCMPSFIRAYADHKQVISKEQALALGGICERSERILITIIGLGLGLAFSMHYFVYSLIIVSFLSLITIIQRLLQIKNSL